MFIHVVFTLMEDLSFLSFFRTTLKLPAEWVVDGVRMDAAQRCVYVDISYHGPEVIYDHQAARKWRHLDLCEYQTFIVARLPRTRSSSGELKVIPAPWSSPMQRISTVLERQIIHVALLTKNRSATSKVVDLKYGTVLRTCRRAVLRGLARKQITEAVTPTVIRYIGIDDKCYGWPRRMATIVTDTERQCVLAVVDGHTQASAEQVLSIALLPSQRAQLLAVSMDMWDAYAAAVNTMLPGVPIVHDKYHLEKLNQRAIDQTRRQEVQEHPELRGKRFWLLRRTTTQPPKIQAFFEAIQEANMVTAHTWQAAADFRAVYKFRNRRDARLYLQTWIFTYWNTDNLPLRRLVVTFKNYLEGIVNYFDHRITNAVAERINGKIQEIKLLAKGFRTFQNFKDAVLFYLGGLDLDPLTSE